MLDRGNGMVLKALQNPPRGTRELDLYQTTFAPACCDKHLLELRNFLPLYYGTEVLDDGGCEEEEEMKGRRRRGWRVEEEEEGQRVL